MLEMTRFFAGKFDTCRIDANDHQLLSVYQERVKNSGFGIGRTIPDGTVVPTPACHAYTTELGENQPQRTSSFKGTKVLEVPRTVGFKLGHAVFHSPSTRSK
jgi:hypothetical protein